MDEMKMTELDRPQLLEIGYRLGLGALDRNDIPHPGITVHWPKPHRHRDLGWYRSGPAQTARLGRLTVNLPRTRLATRTPGYVWSFPGYKADRTPVGVFTHELGHHVDDYRGRPRLTTWRDEAPVSGYEPNRQEMFAEAFRLLCTNPDLLRVGRPARWRTLTEELGFDPGDLEPWEERLARWGAHEKFLAAAKSFIKAGQRT